MCVPCVKKWEVRRWGRRGATPPDTPCLLQGRLRPRGYLSVRVLYECYIFGLWAEVLPVLWLDRQSSWGGKERGKARFSVLFPVTWCHDYSGIYSGPALNNGRRSCHPWGCTRPMFSSPTWHNCAFNRALCLCVDKVGSLNEDFNWLRMI